MLVPTLMVKRRLDTILIAFLGNALSLPKLRRPTGVQWLAMVFSSCVYLLSLTLDAAELLL